MLHSTHMETTKQNTLGLGLIAAGIVLAALIGAGAFLQSKAETLTVTGSAKMHVSADTAKWSFTLVRKTRFANQKDAYTLLANDRAKVVGYFTARDIPENSIVIDAPMFMQDYETPQGVGIEPTYRVSARVTINSDDVEKIKSLSGDIVELASQGLYITDTNVSYLYSKLPDVRVALSGDALKDARARAEAIAKASGQKIGKLKTVSSGVVQVTAPNSVDVSDYGTYDTSTIEKDITFSVRAGFIIK